MAIDLSTLSSKVEKYQEILQNTESYRKSWKDSIKERIKSNLQALIDETGIAGSIEEVMS